jgi:hypothetical protein
MVAERPEEWSQERRPLKGTADIHFSAATSATYILLDLIIFMMLSKEHKL